MTAKRKAAPGHTTSCYYDDRDREQRCVYWCPTGGMFIHLEKCVETLEGLYLAAGHPAREVRIEARVALEKWRRG